MFRPIKLVYFKKVIRMPQLTLNLSIENVKELVFQLSTEDIYDENTNT